MSDSMERARNWYMATYGATYVTDKLAEVLAAYAEEVQRKPEGWHEWTNSIMDEALAVEEVHQAPATRKLALSEIPGSLLNDGITEVEALATGAERIASDYWFTSQDVIAELRAELADVKKLAWDRQQSMHNKMHHSAFTPRDMTECCTESCREVVRLCKGE